MSQFGHRGVQFFLESASSAKRFKRFLEYLPKIVTFRTHRINGYLFRSHLIKSYLESHEVTKLHIGAAANILDGWLNTDLKPRSKKVVFLDVEESFPTKSCTFDYVYSEHVVEHLPYNVCRFMLQESYRILRPEGRIRIATPDLERLIGLLSPKRDDLQEHYIRWIIDRFLPYRADAYRPSIVINNAFQNWGHRFIYDSGTLRDILAEAGFVDIVKFAPGESNDDMLKGIENHGSTVNNEEMNRFETMVLEARRP